MSLHFVLSMLLLIWSTSACKYGPAGGVQTQQPPGQHALAHFCKHMAQGPSRATLALPAKQRQAAWLAEMTDAATAANIEGWPSFRTAFIKDVDHREKQAWLELGVKTHGLHAECTVILQK
jgi:hypothetical protein